MKSETMTKLVFVAGLAMGLGAGVAFAQTAGQDMKDAGHDTKNAAVDTGHATKRVAKKTATGTKHVATKTATGTKHVAKKTATGTKHVAVAAGHRTENAGDAIAGKPATH
ncbi:MAG TPA: hypothetical protein VGU23_03185 [Acidobacteriaceae bacterium]|nr:hypothetical protein [Acidobacteriaceae bacterium]